MPCDLIRSQVLPLSCVFLSIKLGGIRKEISQEPRQGGAEEQGRRAHARDQLTDIRPSLPVAFTGHLAAGLRLGGADLLSGTA